MRSIFRSAIDSLLRGMAELGGAYSIYSLPRASDDERGGRPATQESVVAALDTAVVDQAPGTSANHLNLSEETVRRQ